MTPDTCTLLAQITPLLLIVAAWFNTRIAALKGKSKQGPAFWFDIAGLFFALVSLILCVLGVNQGGLVSSWQIALAFGGFYLLLSNVFLNVLYIHTVDLPN